MTAEISERCSSREQGFSVFVVSAARGIQNLFLGPSVHIELITSDPEFLVRCGIQLRWICCLLERKILPSAIDYVAMNGIAQTSYNMGCKKHHCSTSEIAREITIHVKSRDAKCPIPNDPSAQHKSLELTDNMNVTQLVDPVACGCSFRVLVN